MAGHSCPRSLSSFMHRHTLTLYDYTGRPTTRVCDICNEPALGLLYRCQPCGFDVHPLYTLLPRQLQHALHRHPLILNPSANRPCAVCRRICTRWRYSCNGCNFDIHPGCVLKRSVSAPPGARRPPLRRVQMPPQQRRIGLPQQRVAVGGPPNNNHFTPNLHYQHVSHRPQYYVQHGNSAIVQRPFDNHGGYMVGTAVVTRANDGRLAVGRLGAIFKQLEKLNSRGFEIILVTSGAVGAGRQRLKYRRLINSSFADLQKPQVELDGKACASVGQNGLMAVYDTLFSQLDVTSSQLLVTDNDFKNADFRSQLTPTVNSLLALRSIPIFNENDAISTRRAPYEDSSDIFWDNDSLAALLAMELNADLLVLLSDVDGLYSGPPNDPRSKIIHTYIKEKHQGVITFGDKSRMGRGGMDAKVKAASNAAYSGTPVVIASGFIADNIIKVLNGDRIGTLFHKDAHLWVPLTEVGAHEMAVAARESSRRLQGLSSLERKKILLDVAEALIANESFIMIENEADVAAAREAGYDESLVARLALKPGKIAALADSVRTLADMEEPIGRTLKKTEIADGLILEKQSCPMGVLLIIFESRPDALVQIASLAIRSGNGLLLKGGKEAKLSNAILYKVVCSAIPETVGDGLIGLLTSREEIPDLLKLDDVIDLVIPRGSNKLVSQIKNSTKIPVLGHADGICHVYVDKLADMDMATRIVVDAKTEYPSACNAMETLLVHQDLSTSGGVQELVRVLENEGVILYGGPRVTPLFNLPTADSFSHEYSSRACTIEIVDDVDAAINHINKYGSSHTDCIVTEDNEVAERFLSQVDSAAVFHNASTRFCDGARFGLGAEVGISTSKIHARGPVEVEGLLTTRWILRGNGQVVDGDKGVVYTHKNLDM